MSKSNVSIFINGNHFYRGFKRFSQGENRIVIDFIKMAEWIKTQVKCDRVHSVNYYSTLDFEPVSQAQINLTNFLNMLDETQGYLVNRFANRTFPHVCDCGEESNHAITSTLDVAMGIDISKIVIAKPDHTIVIVSPDYSQESTLKFATIMGRRVFLAGWDRYMKRKALKRACLGYVKLADGVEDFKLIIRPEQSKDYVEEKYKGKEAEPVNA